MESQKIISFFFFDSSSLTWLHQLNQFPEHYNQQNIQLKYFEKNYYTITSNWSSICKIK